MKGDSAASSGSLAGRTALITGATGRLGRAIALSLAARGATIILHYHRSREKAEALAQELHNGPAEARLLEADFRAPGSGEALLESALKLSGTFDILVNNASLFTGSTCATVTQEDFFDNLRVNAWAPFVIGRAFSRITEKGIIINILDSRIAGYDLHHAGYIVSKHALAELTRMMAMAFAPGITVNAVAPGLVPPEEGSIEAGATVPSPARIPLQCFARPGDVADAVCYLAASEAISGQTIFVDGGRHMREHRPGG